MTGLRYSIGEVMQMLKQLRESKGLTQMELARRSGVPQSTICDIEAGRTKGPTLRVAVKLAAALGVPVERLLPEEVPGCQNSRQS